ncbi:MAG: sigma-70 family RNA polymerase sigma factor [Acidimicrobiia bacterium]|nr:sigma-70 family RNA polymerase sigma factor [Acidimicrobiia bacterium]
MTSVRNDVGDAESNSQSMSTPETPSVPDGSQWRVLVERIQSGDNSAMEELYSLFSRGIRFYLCRQLGPQELDDKVHDTFLIVVQAIQRGDLREPERLMGFIRTVVRRQVAAFIDNAVHSRREQMDLETGVSIADNRQNPEQNAIIEQQAGIMKEVLDDISSRDREILTRFYLHEQPQEQICQEMNLSETQFRLLKSRAKARFGELGRKKLNRKSLNKLSMRNTAGS